VNCTICSSLSRAFYLSARGSGDGLWRVDDARASEVRSGAAEPLAEPALVSPDGRSVAIVVRRDGKRRLLVMAADGTNVRTLTTAIDIQGAAGQGIADWSPDGKWIVTGGSDGGGPGLFKVPVDGGRPVRLVTGDAASPVWSPDGHLIIYAGPLDAGQVTLHGIDPDGRPVQLPPLRVRQGGYRFTPTGAALVYLPTLTSLDFWLLDLTSAQSRRLTRLDDRGKLQTFDITTDGKALVFDRTQQYSDIVLIDRPR
jgi:Tol biopolymer transport system component